MRSPTNWLQLLANIALIVGLILVAVEIRQNSDLTRADLYSQHLTNWQDTERSKIGESLSVTIAKSIDTPEKLTSAEMVELEGYYRSILQQFVRRVELKEMGVFVLPSESIVCGNFKRRFGTKFALAWWEVTRSEWHPTVETMLEECVDQTRSLESAEMKKLQEIRSLLVREEA
ncbi:MAG: hypothetical protein RJQ07_05920 [Pseudomonadales bacterium]